MHFSRDFFELQLSFARKIVQITEQNLDEVLHDYTALREIFGLRISHHDDKQHPVWQEFLEGMHKKENSVEWIYQFYLLQQDQNPICARQHLWFGCFSFADASQDSSVVRLYFEACDTSGALRKDSARCRMFELRSMFQHIRQAFPEAEAVRGGSWLYNIPEYRRLFPPEYIRTAEPAGYETDSVALWGQFVKSNGNLRDNIITRFLHCLENQTILENCLRCFPYEVLRPMCPIEVFYTFYGIV